MYYKEINDGYITSIGTGNGDIAISKDEYDELAAIIKAKPAAPEGFCYKLKADLSLVLVELPPMPEYKEEASAEDYENALGRFGV